jgi:lysophospholipase L1-like esterase/dienelactone hydrolase
LLLIPDMPWKPEAKVERQFEHDGLHIEELSWQLPYGPRTRAVFMKPAGSTGRLPGVIALHDHGGISKWGVSKVVRLGPDDTETAEHQKTFYGGRAWANELARRGYAVLVHDTIGFASRNPGVFEEKFEKSLLCVGTLWAGLVLYDDRRALDYLCSRPDVDPERIGCGGLSGGGLRTVFLGGVDPRIEAAFPVGWMTTWRDVMLYKSHKHTWMLYVPGLPRHLDYPEILGLRVPKPVFVLNDAEDELFTPAEMREADRILREVYEKASAAENYRCTFYPGPHKFDRGMQDDAFAWLDGVLKSPRPAAAAAAPSNGDGLARTRRLVAEKKPVRVVAFGDSISEVKPGWNGGAKSPDANWAAVLVKRLGEKHPSSEFTLRHFAIGGQNTYEGLGRLDGLEAHGPDLVLVAFGANDCCHHFLEPHETGRALAELVTAIRTRFAADIVVVGTGGDNPHKPFFRHLDETLAAQRAAAAEAAAPFVDVRAAILEATAGGDRWADFHFNADNCHPTDKGHEVWADAALRTIEQGLQATHANEK